MSLSPASWLVGAGRAVRGGAVGGGGATVGASVGVSGSKVNVGIGVGVAVGAGLGLSRTTGCGARQAENAAATRRATQARRNEPTEQG